MSAIHVDGLRKVYRVPVREAGLRASVRSLFRREHRDIVAVDGISFDIAPGEIVGFLGPNGAGKTTTLKMLSGLLHPDGGTGTVLGHTPAQRRRHIELLESIVSGAVGGFIVSALLSPVLCRLEYPSGGSDRFGGGASGGAATSWLLRRIPWIRPQAGY